MKKLLASLASLISISIMSGCASYHQGMSNLTAFVDKAHCYTNKNYNPRTADSATGFMLGNEVASCQTEGTK